MRRASGTRGLSRVCVAIFVAISWLFLVTHRAAADTVVVWHAYRGAELQALEQVLDTFRKTHPGDSIESLSIPFDAYASKLEAAIPHGHGPDVFVDAHERLGDYLDKRLVAPIELNSSLFDPVSVAAVTVHGRTLAAPLSRKCLALYLRGPTWPADKRPMSLAELVLAPPVGHGASLAYDPSNAYLHAPLLHAFGGKMIADDGIRYAFADGPAEKSLGWVLTALKLKAIPVESSGALVKQLFSSKELGADAAIDGPWLAADLPGDLAFHVVPIPPVQVGMPPARPYLTVEGAMLAPIPRSPKLARELIDHLTSHTSALIRARVGRQVVATKSAWDDPSLKTDSFLLGFAAAADVAVPMPIGPNVRAAWEPTTRAIQKVLRGDVSPRVAMEEAERRFLDVTRPLPDAKSPTIALLMVGLVGLFAALKMVQAARSQEIRTAFRESLPAYAYVTHAVIIVALLVVVPLVIGAITSLFVNEPSGDLRYVGLTNYWDILKARGAPLLSSGSFYAVLLVTVLWTVLNVALHLAIGVVLALLLSRPALKLKGAYRVLLVVPWAVPSYVSALAWKGMFHRQMGAVNAILGALGIEPVSWFSSFATAFSANVTTNVWLGFPFMMIVTLGALTSINREVLEAAEIDGATRWQRFRYVTWPLLWPVLSPSVVLGAVWTFNMFNVVFLVSGGEPDGRTEILVSEAYRWAFTRRAQYGYASAYSVLIFFLLVLMTRVLKPKQAA